MAKCSVCGSYNDPFEWPSDEVPNYRPDMCFNCFQTARDEGTLEPEEGDSPDQPDQDEEPTVDPEIDDSPCFNDSENNETLEDENDESNEPGDEIPDEATNIQNLRKMLFG